MSAALDPSDTGPNRRATFDISGRVALITGAGRGIGLAMAGALAAAGVAVAIQDIDLDVAEAEAGKINQNGGRAVALAGDVTELSLAATLVDQTMEKLGGLHILINNAAVQQTQHWLRDTPEQIERQLRANLVLPILLCQHAAPILSAQKWGRIISIGSIQGKTGNPSMLAYAISKAALENMTKALACDLAEDLVTVNLLCPGWFDTWRNRQEFATPQDKIEKGKQAVPLRRIGEPQDFAGITLLLCSEAGGYITGQTIYIDGGMSVKQPL
jgi:NAD(P)-dependent dehydrogenase (short-subunit alcohol dehydrogenase family)